MLNEATQLDLERRLVGSILLRGEVFWDLPAECSPAVIASPGLRRGFEALARLAEAKRLPSGEVDIGLLVANERLPDSAAVELATASREADSPFARAPVVDIAKALVDRHRRSALAESLSAAAQALRGAAPTEEITGKLVARLLDLDRPERPEVVSYREAALACLDVVEQQKTGKGSVVRTGFPDLDSILRIRKGNLIVLAARPGVGKTTLAIDIADNVAVTQGHVLVHSLEMSDAEVVTLTISRSAEIDSETFFDDQQWPQSRWDKAGRAIEQRIRDDRGQPCDGRLWINDSHYTLGALCRITEKMHRKMGLALVVIDYLNLVQVDLGKGFNREQQIATITRTLKQLAQRLQVPIMALSQFNRESEKRNANVTVPKCARCNRPQSNHRPDDRHTFEKPPLSAPKLHELRESGAIEQDANAALILHNPYAESDDPVQRKRGPYELIVAKQRLGKKGKVRLWGDLEHARFQSFSNKAGPEGTHWSDGGEP